MSKSITLAIPIMGQLNDTKGAWGSLLHTVEGPIDLMVIDNAPKENDGQMGFFERFITPYWPGEVDYRFQEDNLGLIESLQFAYENTDHDIIAYMHNDVYVYEEGWDRHVIEIFEQEDKCGLVGFFGALGLHQNSGRFYVVNNMLEAEIHGGRIEEGYAEVAVLDGMAMFCGREMLDAKGGVDREFKVHHFYDLDLSLESLDRGYRNFALFTPIHHHSGLTANRPLFNDWANKFEEMDKGQDLIYEKNKLRFLTKWQKRLPYEVGKGWGNSG